MELQGTRGVLIDSLGADWMKKNSDCLELPFRRDWTAGIFSVTFEKFFMGKFPGLQGENHFVSLQVADTY